MRRGLLALGGTVVATAMWKLWRVNAELPDGRVLNAAEVRARYDDAASSYDVATMFYDLVGARRLAREGVVALGLRPGDTVIDLGCGTGVNLPGLADAVAPGGTVVGVDLSEQMLARARTRVERDDVSVEFICGDMREALLPTADAVLSTFALEMVPEHERVVAAAVAALRPGGMIAVVGLQEPPGWPNWLVRAAIWMNAPFGTTAAYRDIAPRESILMQTTEVVHATAMAGAVYLSVGRTTGSHTC